MVTKCYELVRGSGIRATELTVKGRVPDMARFATSKSVVRVQVREVVESADNEMLTTPDGDKRVRLTRAAQTIRNVVDISFLRVDPGMLGLVTGVTPVYKPDPDKDGFGEGEFGGMFFGGEEGRVIGFDEVLRRKPVAFGLEVWSKLAGRTCEDGSPMHGYTLFPYLRGGRLTRFSYANGRVSFDMVGAQTRKNPLWGVGPHDLEGYHQRLLSHVSRNGMWRQFITPASPPVEVCGVQTLDLDVIDNGNAANPMPDPSAPMIIDGGGATTSPWIIDGGRA